MFPVWSDNDSADRKRMKQYTRTVPEDKINELYGKILDFASQEVGWWKDNRCINFVEFNLAQGTRYSMRKKDERKAIKVDEASVISFGNGTACLMFDTTEAPCENRIPWSTANALGSPEVSAIYRDV